MLGENELSSKCPFSFILRHISSHILTSLQWGFLLKLSCNYNWQYFLYLPLYLDIKNGSIVIKIKEQEFEIKCLYDLPLPPYRPQTWMFFFYGQMCLT